MDTLPNHLAPNTHSLLHTAPPPRPRRSKLINHQAFSGFTLGGLVATITLRETVITGNAYPGVGTALQFVFCNAVVESCSVLDNTGGYNLEDPSNATAPITPQLGAGISCAGSNCTLHNTLVWDASAAGVARVYSFPDNPNISPSVMTATYCNTKSGGAPLPGAGNLAVDPKLLPAPSFVPGTGSPMINAGDPDTSSNPDALDYAGNPRVQSGRQDIGALESGLGSAGGNRAPALVPGFSPVITRGKGQVCVPRVGDQGKIGIFAAEQGVRCAHRQ
jgi:hypothetical protein